MQWHCVLTKENKYAMYVCMTRYTGTFGQTNDDPTSPNWSYRRPLYFYICHIKKKINKQLIGSLDHRHIGPLKWTHWTNLVQTVFALTRYWNIWLCNGLISPVWSNMIQETSVHGDHYFVSIRSHVSRALAKILKLPIIFERVPIQNGLKCIKWSKMVIFCPSKMEVTWTCQNGSRDRFYLRPCLWDSVIGSIVIKNRFGWMCALTISTGMFELSNGYKKQFVSSRPLLHGIIEPFQLTSLVQHGSIDIWDNCSHYVSI